MGAHQAELVALLAEIDDETLVSVVVRKKGVERGAGADKTVYGDDLTHVLLWTGWDYRKLCLISQAYLRKLDKQGQTLTNLIRQARRDGHADVTLAEAAVAVQEIRESLWRSLSEGSGPPSGTGASNYVPVTVAGRRVPGCKMYNGPDRRDKDPRAPEPNTIYVCGLKLGESVLEAAPNGDWTPKSAPKTIAKDYMRRRLPIGRYVEYALPPSGGHVLSVGYRAVEAAREDGVHVDPGAIMALFKLAQVAQDEATTDPRPLPDGVEAV